MIEHESDYNSSEDEDYVPEDEDDVDYPSGDEVDEINDADAEVLTTRRSRSDKNKSLGTSSKSAYDCADDGGKDDAEAAFMALMAEEDPILKKRRFETARDSSSLAQRCESFDTMASTSSSSAQSVNPESKAEAKRVTEVYDFAGDEVRVEREVTSEEAQEIEAREKRKENGKLKKPVQKRLSLGGALTLLAKKPKMSILDKSNLDWTSYKTENNLQEELETFNRGKNGYLDRMEFLTRTDYKEFEKEKELRNAARKLL
ncbi:bucentaur or craniofacial development [Dictyocaulus viviparus]|uniref:Craniofacial development protein 1 n=1 Tax=Dictyocaulus viviparus TaxID=29172 RepID=A0A0D8YB99_DICVI|nr:bucentaur or craniofacial development [Dictyocaulus viviparus]